MKKLFGLFCVTLIAAIPMLPAGCTESPEVERKDPRVEILPSLRRIIAVMDKRTGERRQNEPVLLKRTDETGGEAIADLGEFTTDASGEFEAVLEEGFYRAEFSYTAGTEPDIFVPFEVKNPRLHYSIAVEDPDADYDPHEVTVTLIDAKRQSPWAGKEFLLYRLAEGGGTDSLGRFTTGSDGSVVLEQKLYKGAYLVKAAYYPATRAQAYQEQRFTVGRKETNHCTLTVEPILFVERLGWQKAEWNLINTSGVLQSVKPATWYGYDEAGLLASGGAGDGQRCDMPRASDVEKAVAGDAEWKDEYVERRRALDSTGLEFGGPYGILFFNGDDRNRPCWSLSLPSGAIKGSGGIKTPANTGAPDRFDMRVSLRANPGHKLVEGEWVVEAAFKNNVDVEIVIEGGGHFLNETQQPVTTLVLDNPSMMDTPPIAAPDHWNPLETVVYDATPQTRLVFKGVGKGKVRLLLADIVLEEIY